MSKDAKSKYTEKRLDLRRNPNWPDHLSFKPLISCFLISWPATYLASKIKHRISRGVNINCLFFYLMDLKFTTCSGPWNVSMSDLLDSWVGFKLQFLNFLGVSFNSLLFQSYIKPINSAVKQSPFLCTNNYKFLQKFYQ